MNVGFLESLKFNKWDCFMLHDVDLLPMDEKNCNIFDIIIHHNKIKNTCKEKFENEFIQTYFWSIDIYLFE